MERKVNYGQRWDGKFNETGADDAGKHAARSSRAGSN